MKKSLTINKKWILTTSLLALLVTQYSHQSSSLNSAQAQQITASGEFVLASRAPSNDDQQSTRPARPPRPQEPNTEKKPDAEKPVVTADQKSEPTKTADSAEEQVPVAPSEETKPSTEASANTEGACTEGCDTPSTEAKTIADLMKRITDLENLVKQSQQKTQAQAPAAKKEESEYDCDVPAADASRTEKRDYAKCIKDEKEKARKEANKEKFEDRVADLKDKCDQDLECLTSGITSLFSRFTGKNAVSATDANKAFRDLLGAPLMKALYSQDTEAVESTLLSLQGLMQDMPEEYRSLKQGVMNVVKNQASLAAKKVSDGYAKLQTLSQQSNPQAYFQALQETQAEQQRLTYLSNSYAGSIEQSLQMSGDTNTLSYYQKSFMPDMQKILAGMVAPSQPTTTTQQPGTTTPTTTRDTRNGQPITSSTTPAIQDPNKMVRPDQVWTFPSGNSGFNYGTPTPTSRGTRGPQQ